MPNPTGVGFFGKLPGAGDFVQRRLPARFVEIWDRSFEQAVDASRGALGEGWHAAYRSSPVWRFVLAQGVCGESAWAGVTGPAADRVGRCFPMVLAAPLADPASVTQALRGDDWFDALERVHTVAQADVSMHADAFDAQVTRLPGPLDAMVATPTELPPVDWSVAAQWRLPLAPASVGAQLTELWARLAATREAWCLWWTRGAGQVPASVVATRGLPQPSAYAGFLDAAQTGASWQSLGVFGRLTANAPASHETVAPSVTTIAAPPARLPDDLSDVFADLMPSASVTPAGDEAVGEIHAGAPSSGVVVLQRDDVALTVVAADEGAPDPRRQAAALSGATVAALDAGELAAGMQPLRTRLLALHPRLRLRGEDLIDPVPEDGALIAVRITERWADLLRIGTAAAWHWRRGQLQPLFATGGAVRADDDTARPGDFDDLLFSRSSPLAPGLGAATQPLCDEVVCAVEEGDRLLLVATRVLVQLSPDVFSRALAMPSCDDARARIATAASLGSDPARWPLAVIEIRS
ncbi:type VI secretion system-associated protein TagF [Rhodanobacter koreensis]